MPLIKREFYIPCRGEECFKLAEIINEKVPQVEFIDISIEENGLRILMYGYKSDIKRAWQVIKQLVKTHRSAIATGPYGLKRISLQYIVEEIHKTYPPLLLEYVLKRKGYYAKLSDDGLYILTNADIDEVLKIADRIHNLTNTIRDLVKGTSTKYFIVAASIILGVNPREVIELALEKGLLDKTNDKYMLRKEWRQALEEVIRDSNTQ